MSLPEPSYHHALVIPVSIVESSLTLGATVSAREGADESGLVQLLKFHGIRFCGLKLHARRLGLRLLPSAVNAHPPTI